MLVTLTQRARVWHEAGDTVKVSPAEAARLLSVGVAVLKPAKEKEEAAPKKTKKTND